MGFIINTEKDKANVQFPSYEGMRETHEDLITRA